MIIIEDTSYEKEYACNFKVKRGSKREIVKDKHDNDKRLKQLKLDKLIDEIELSYQDMKVILNGFDRTLEPDLIEYYTYQYKAAEIKHGYLLKKIKNIYYKVNN